MTISDHLVETGETGTERGLDPVEIIKTTATRRTRRYRDGKSRSSARYTFDVEDDDRKYYIWSTPAAFAFFATLIVLSLLFAEFLGLFIDLQHR
jgi:hypothetical protein